MFAILYSTGAVGKRFDWFSDAERFAQSEAAILRADTYVVEQVFGAWVIVGGYTG